MQIVKNKPSTSGKKHHIAFKSFAVSECVLLITCCWICCWFVAAWRMVGGVETLAVAWGITLVLVTVFTAPEEMSFCKSAADIILVCVPDGAEDGWFVVVCCSFIGVVDFTSWLAISDCRTTTRCIFATDEGLLLGVRIEGVSSLWVGPKKL